MENLYDVMIIGGGPSGLTAALYLARAKYRVLVVEKGQIGGQIAITQEVVNYPGIEKISGEALGESMKRQAHTFGADFITGEATALELSGDIKTVTTTAGEFRCFGLLLATGAQPRIIGFRGEEAHRGRGVAYCATCDGEFFTGKEVFVIGGGYAAAEESVFLTKFARHVTILMRKGDFSCAKSLADKAKNHEKITVLPHTVVEEVGGEQALQYIRYKNTATGEVTVYRAEGNDFFGVFVLAGYVPSTALVQGLVDLDDQGYIITDKTQQTSVSGVFAAGDVCIKPLRQVVTATGDGALAATALEKYVTQLHQRTGLKANAPEIPASAPARATPEGNAGFSQEIQQQLQEVFAKMESHLELRLHLDESPLSQELREFIANLCDFTDKLTLSVAPPPERKEDAPWVSVCHADGRETGLSFHGVPGGHEFTSFVLGLYNAAGPGQPISPEQQRKIQSLRKPVDMKIFVTLSCTMCPELVRAAQRIAAESPWVTSHVYDIRHFPEYKAQYNVMSVPCLVLNDQQVTFGKKTLEELIALIQTI